MKVVKEIFFFSK